MTSEPLDKHKSIVRRDSLHDGLGTRSLYVMTTASSPARGTSIFAALSPVIACPVGYGDDAELIRGLGGLDESLP